MSATEPTAGEQPPGLLRHRARVAEAIAWLGLARMLVAVAPFNRWEAWLGRRIRPDAPGPAPISAADALRSRRAGRAVDQAARYLPLELKCLPRAMALQWMLKRRRIPARLLIGVLPASERGSTDDLHAWVVAGKETVIGDLGSTHLPVTAIQLD